MGNAPSKVVRLSQRPASVADVNKFRSADIHADPQRGRSADHLKALDALALQLRDLKGVLSKAASEFRADCFAAGAPDPEVRLKELQDMVEAQERAMHRLAGALTVRLPRWTSSDRSQPLLLAQGRAYSRIQPCSPTGRIAKVVTFATDITAQMLRNAEYEGPIGAINIQRLAPVALARIEVDRDAKFMSRSAAVVKVRIIAAHFSCEIRPNSPVPASVSVPVSTLPMMRLWLPIYRRLARVSSPMPTKERRAWGSVGERGSHQVVSS